MLIDLLNAIGNTPLVRISRALHNAQFSLLAKLEGFNPGGSMKDRPALAMIRAAIESGEVGALTTVVESSSGNMGIGLAQVCRYYGLQFICVIDPKTTDQNVRLLKTYGAQLDMVTEPDPNTGSFLESRLDRVRELVRTTPNSYWPNQYANPNNARAHWQTMHEIAHVLEGKVDYLFCATSTCGTLRGCAEYVKANGLPTKIIAVDAEGSVIFGRPPGVRLLPGHGASVRPSLFQQDLADECVHVGDVDCVIGCRTLLSREAMLVGGSSGAVFAAISRLRHRLRRGSTCVGIFADRGDRYLDTIYSDSWVHEHIGEVRNLDSPETKEATCLTANSFC